MTDTRKQATEAAAPTPPITGRHAAGEDPAKREQILDGAKRIFMGKGFDAASMNDVAREAGVSKGTIYVYFQNKEDLFADLIERERTRFALSTRDALEKPAGVEDALFHFGMTFCQHMMNDDVICSMRSVIGVIDRMPGLARRFFSSESVNVRSVLRDYLEMQRMQGKLAIDDTDLAARQLIDMCSGSYFKLRLFGEMKKPPPREELDRVIGSAVRVFMAAYRRAA
ncbi:MAG: TetR family transcriptional regulator [Rhizobiales bacterium 63-7]|uniref:TetR/AcrR family transcriptional regulator n=1 Tax=Rhizobium sp. YJ-22 TaxID=3037556 RepID=UPI00092848A4|nr:TetR/AcrR family transcriptional regulator [Rhizobium sp. YJ-22]MBN9030053.1 TetR/AcrR family transcriptional regulator [Hyphomicrobiales bacterium]MDG3578845.1 TetR/AcrR family transcriptional regulator [Rhizobium sp. YJ-22]OJU68775.1 MAG: TetR family transcriptional regulator [Rhizobiales bacterium 63-7]